MIPAQIFTNIVCPQYIFQMQTKDQSVKMTNKSKYGSDQIKEHFNKECLMTKKDDEDFENTTKSRICKVRDHCHETEKMRGSMYRSNKIIKFMPYYTT